MIINDQLRLQHYMDAANASYVGISNMMAATSHANTAIIPNIR